MEVANAQVQVTMKNQTMAELNFSNRKLRDESTRHQEWCKALEMQLKGATEQLDKVKVRISWSGPCYDVVLVRIN